MTTPSSVTIPAVVDRTALGTLGSPVSKGDGESLMVTRLVRWPGYLFKQFRPGVPVADDDDRLDRLIALPRRLDAAARVQLREASCWPVARVIDTGRTVGVVLPRAPDKFNAALRSITGTGDPKPLAIDWLAKDGNQQAQRGLPAVTFEQRVMVCRDIAAVAAILEREGIVYGDWSYANALWSVTDFRGFLIDVDSCAFGTRPWVGTPNWEDPLTPQGMRVDLATDRYRLAIMIARCLSGKRDVAEALNAAVIGSRAAGRPGLGRVLASAVNAFSREFRPTAVMILRSLATEPPGHVAGWKPIVKRAPLRLPAPVGARPLFPPIAPKPPVQPPAWPVVPPASRWQSPAPRPPATARPSVRMVLCLTFCALVLLFIVLLSV